jgi:hypothetical protein
MQVGLGSDYLENIPTTLCWAENQSIQTPARNNSRILKNMKSRLDASGAEQASSLRMKRVEA